MVRYIIRRILYLIPVLICVSFLIYALMDLTPGTVADNYIPNDATEEERAEIYARFDLDKPMIYRYGKYMFNFVQGDLGRSAVTNEKIFEVYMKRFPATFLLGLASIFIAGVVAVPLGILAARHAGSVIDNGITVFTLIGMALPNFLIGLVFLFAFSLKLKWFPAGSDGSLKSFILPAVCNGLSQMAGTARQTRSAMLDVLRSDFLRTARAKGVSEKKVIWKHALGNAMIPILTTLGGHLCSVMAGSVVIESIFAWPGVGRLTTDAIQARDTQLACGAVILSTILYVVMQLLVDLMYAAVDPRIKASFIRSAKRRRKAA